MKFMFNFFLGLLRLSVFNVFSSHAVGYYLVLAALTDIFEFPRLL